MRVLVTGGTGYVGGWCIAELLRRGYDVRTTVRSAAKEAAVRRAVAGEVDPGDHLEVVVADLLDDTGWPEAVAGCTAVLHVASPLGGDGSRDPNALIAPARDGALRVLKAATAAGVSRVVLTSSLAAAAPPIGTRSTQTYDETLWTDTTDRRLNPYRRSKAVAERAAWDFIASTDGATTLATVLPGAILGPVLDGQPLGSVQLIGALLDGRFPGVPRLGYSITDVRDLADLHLRAMLAPEAAGERFVAVSEFLWLRAAAEELRAKLGQDAAKVPTRSLPDFLLRALGLINAEVREVAPDLGRKNVYTSAKAQHLLDWQPRPAATTVVDCARSLAAIH
ncbi:NAD-dependent epimerase/dehydratase family protein [Amycolatopsis rhabdoformis]|uniref:NAD-dependent epimerase/dehydratase family protein n=1 Tax=Amycolatopsis rhabdoformis TaxID=1448059 RepID=A0ABZ1HZV0_9PSEU|nr:NAD-dependent epimerase/dehydratase family protein [Amycolatopsis rhabdoformis]WSE27071.1 NAD-dependent epimerase/dehydratase family protein [Amycolatopsis rhabdoformis]